MPSKQDLLSLARKEFETTLKVLAAVPEGKESFKPHERSSDTLKLVSTFVFEMYLADGYVFGTKVDSSKFKDYKPGEVKTAMQDFRAESANVLRKLEDALDSDLAGEVEFAGARFTKAEFLQMMIHDQIHHRGQLTVYIRLAGGSVPSVYGPSADDKSTNL